DVRFLNLDIGAPLDHFDALVMLIDGDGEFLLRLFLADDIFVEKFFDLGGLGQWRARGRSLLLHIVTDDLDTDINALVANVDGGASDEFLDFVLALTAEATA